MTLKGNPLPRHPRPYYAPSDAYAIAYALNSQAAAREGLKGYVDRYGCAGVLALLSEVCNEKAGSLRENWNDSQSARVWERDGRRLAKLSALLA